MHVRRWRWWLPLVVLMMAFVAGAAEYPIFEPKFQVFGRVDYFTWKETGPGTPGGKPLVDEKGPLFGLGLKGFFGNKFRLELGMEGFLGEVDYEGFIQGSGPMIPYNSKTAYGGGAGFIDLAYWIDLDQVALKPYAGFGARAWNRVLDADGFSPGKYGYEETWLALYGTLGAGASIGLGPRVSLGAKVELRLPLHNEERVDLSHLGGPSSIDLEPGKEVCWYGELSFNFKLLTVAAFFETFDFSASDASQGYMQPKSENRLYGVRVGVAF